MDTIKGFFGDYRWLSNFWPAPVKLDGHVYPTVEHAYQAAKVANIFARDAFKLAKTPAEAKKLGRYVDLRDGWEFLKLSYMELLIWRKFQIPDLQAKLLATGDAYLEETNTWGDVFWGVCNGFGENHLGKIIMGVRSELPKHSGVV